eukprot:COSAG04_NODE_9266_length_880_cov_2.833504_1_plen_97_part_10
MPNCVQCAVQAGSAVAFDISCWHVAVPNLSSSSDRVGTIVGYGSDGGGMGGYAAAPNGWLRHAKDALTDFSGSGFSIRGICKRRWRDAAFFLLSPAR